MEHKVKPRSLENSVHKKFSWYVIYSWLLLDLVNSICLCSWLWKSSPKMSQFISQKRSPCCAKLSLQNNIPFTELLRSRQADVSEASRLQRLLSYCWNSLGSQDSLQCSSSTQFPSFWVFVYLEGMWKGKPEQLFD